MNKHQEYYDALERLIKDMPQIVPKGSKVNKRNVALEAGKSNASSIRSGRGLDDLIVAIEQASIPAKKVRQANKVDKLEEHNSQLQVMLDIAHAKYLASMYALLDNGVYDTRKSTAEIIQLPEVDNSKRPVFEAATQDDD